MIKQWYKELPNIGLTYVYTCIVIPPCTKSLKIPYEEKDKQYKNKEDKWKKQLSIKHYAGDIMCSGRVAVPYTVFNHHLQQMGLISI